MPVAPRQLARRVYDAANRAAGTGDYDEWLGFFDPSIEWRPLDGQSYRGLDGITAWFEDWRAAMEQIHWEVEEEHDAGQSGAVLLVHVTARIRGAEQPLDTRYALLFQIADGKVTRLTEFRSCDEALAAAGGAG